MYNQAPAGRWEEVNVVLGLVKSETLLHDIIEIVAWKSLKGHINCICYGS